QFTRESKRGHGIHIEKFERAAPFSPFRGCRPFRFGLYNHNDTNAQTKKEDVFMSHRYKFIGRGLTVFMALWLALSPLSTAFATDVTYGGWLDSIKWGGDLRLRHDTVFATSNGSNRDRDRFRFRYGLNAVSGDLTGIFRMATSAGTAGVGPNTTINGDGLS